jgi:hypothetical protein
MYNICKVSLDYMKEEVSVYLICFLGVRV